MNQITDQDFGLLKSESLTVDYICLNINSSSNLSQLTSYFQALGCKLSLAPSVNYRMKE